jgi:N4-gp56 family major capsid protein
MPITSNFNTANVVNQIIAAKILVTPTRDMIASMFSEPFTTPYNSGAQLVLTRFQQLPPVLTATGGGAQPPPPQQLIRDIIPIVIQRYCNSVVLDTQLVMQDELPWVAVAAERTAVAMRLGNDLQYYNALRSNASVYNCKYGVNGDTPTEITKTDMLEVYAALVYASAPQVTSILPGHDMFGTAPVNACYVAMINPAIVPTLYQISGFAASGAYPVMSSERSPSEFGFLDFFRYWQSANVPILYQSSSQGNDVAITFCVGAKAYAGAFLDADSIQTIYRDPLFSNQNATLVTVGCNLYFGCGITQNTWIVQVRSTVNSIGVF